jgi:GAF domain-containing protein
VLATVADLGVRALALVVRGAELVSAGGAGLHQRGSEPAPTPAIRIPLDQSPLLREVVGTGRCLIAPAADDAVRRALDAAIGAPADPTILLLPLAASGRTVSLIYADFGPGPAAPPPADLLEAIAAQAGTALELVLCRKKLEKLSR